MLCPSLPNLIFSCTQGSVVVFGAYASWTDEEGEEESKKETYCASPPFLCAFVLLLFEWITFPIKVCCVVCAAVAAET